MNQEAYRLYRAMLKTFPNSERMYVDPSDVPTVMREGHRYFVPRGLLEKWIEEYEKNSG